MNFRNKKLTNTQNCKLPGKPSHESVRRVMDRQGCSTLAENLVRRMHGKEGKNAPALTAAFQHHHLFILSGV